jgi:cell division control protein 6
MKSGDLRVGIDLVKRAVLNAEHDARRAVLREDICRAYEISKYLHLTFTVKTLTGEEKILLKTIALMSREEQEMTGGDVYRTLKEQMKIGYTRFYEMVKKLDAMRLVNLHYRQGRGRTRLITLRYEPERVLEQLS